MGRDKALLPYRGQTLVEWTAEVVREAAGSVTIVGSAEKYGLLGLPLIEDRTPGCGPLSGLDAVLAQSGAEWNLVVACDMPNLRSPFLRWLLEEAEHASADVTMPAGEPLCAVYRHTCREPIERALAEGRWKLARAIEPLRVKIVTAADTECLANANTPEDWAKILAHQEVAGD